MSKIRLSAHELAIKKERYSNITREERFCNICKNTMIEDEEYFLLHCPAYSELRATFVSKLQNSTNSGTHFNNTNKIKQWNSNSRQVIKITSSYILNCLDLRKCIYYFIISLKYWLYHQSTYHVWCVYNVYVCALNLLYDCYFVHVCAGLSSILFCQVI